MPLVAAIVITIPPAALAQSAKPAAKPAPKPAAASSIGGATPHLLGQFGDWAAYSAAPGNRPVCFALTKPTSSQTNPPNRRDESMTVYLFVSTRPKEKVKDEVSILITGYGFKPSSDATATVGSTNFALYTQNDGAWIKNAAEEARLVDAMRKGSDLVIKATTSRGTETTDNFSLKGVAEALDRVAQQCK
ncbi:MAG: Invasion associated locus B family protein [Rhizobiales bacterium]|nr:Invasion associated locus B family protein [Hyphomicrobiales bacterium]